MTRAGDTEPHADSGLTGGGIDGGDEVDFRLLSSVLAEQPSGCRVRWLHCYRTALVAGEVQAVLLDQKFTFQTGGKGKAGKTQDRQPEVATTLSTLDEAVFDTPGFREWNERVSKEVKKAAAPGRLKFAVSLEEVRAGTVNLEHLMARHREELKKKSDGKRRVKKSPSKTLKSVKTDHV